MDFQDYLTEDKSKIREESRDGGHSDMQSQLIEKELTKYRQ